MTLRQWVNSNSTSQHDPQLEQARRQLIKVNAEVQTVIRILTAEQALKAERVVKEAGRGRR